MQSGQTCFNCHVDKGAITLVDKQIIRYQSPTDYIKICPPIVVEVTGGRAANHLSSTRLYAFLLIPYDGRRVSHTHIGDVRLVGKSKRS